MPAIRRWYAKAAIRSARDAREWGISPRRALIIALLPFGMALVAAATVLHPPLYIWLLDEDSLVEWLQFFSLVASAILLPILAVRLSKTGHRLIALLYATVAVGVCFLAGEEISWGQRIFGWQTPEAMEAINRQGETTLHNISGVQDLVPAAMLLAGLYGMCAPLVSNAVRAHWKQAGPAHLLIPPLCLVPAFGLGVAYRLFRLLVWPAPDYGVAEFAEVIELSLYLGLALFCWFNLRRLLVARPAARLPRHRLTAAA
jgi:hypothetical protein